MNLGFSLLAVAALILIPLLGVAAAGLNGLFGVWIPCAAFLFFIGGMVYRVALWAKSPVPFHIPTTCGQQKSLPWIQNSRLESPSGTAGVAGRMALEVLLFRSLFRNTKVEMKDGRPVHGGAKWLWLAGLAFHWSFLVIVLRHLRFFSEPILPWVNFLAALDGIFEIGIPSLFVSDALLSRFSHLLIPEKGGHPPGQGHFAAFGYFSPSADPGDRPLGLLHAPCLESRSLPGQVAGIGLGFFSPPFSRSTGGDLLSSPLSRQRPPGIYPPEQAGAHGGGLPQPDAEPGQ